MDLGITGKTALVGGASKGLGYGCALALVREGVNVVIIARGAEALATAQEQLMQARSRSDSFVKAVAADITTKQGREAAFRSEEHTSELQSLMRISYAVFCLKKKIQTSTRTTY